MGLLRRIFGVNALFLFLFCAVNEAKALSFAGFAYQNAKQANIIAIKNYLKKGYKIDSVSPNGYTALCYAAAYNDYPAYSRLRNLGADESHECMQKVNPAYARDLAQRYDAVASHPNYGANLSDSDTSKKYLIAGTALAGTAAAVALLADGGSGGGSSSGSSNPCPNGQELVDGVCVDISCPTGQRWNGSECAPIICPENTHLVGNNCVADDIDIDNNNDEDVYGIYSEEEDVYNLYSDLEHPDNEALVSIDNKGNGNVYGIYGFGNIRNADVIEAGNVGTGDIVINNEGKGNVFGIYSHVEDISFLKEAYVALGEFGGTAYGNLEINNKGGGSVIGVYGDVRAYNARTNFAGSKAEGNITIHSDGDIYGLSGYTNATNSISYDGGGEVKGSINLYSTGDGNVYGLAVSPDGIPGVGQPEDGDGMLRNWFAYNSVVYWDGVGPTQGASTASGIINIHNVGNGNVYGMYGGVELQNAIHQGAVDGEGKPIGVAEGLINIVNLGDGDAYGMYTQGGNDGTSASIGNISNDGARSVINIVNTGDGVTTGLRGGQGSSIENSGEININNLGDGTVVGIYGGANSNIINSGTINIYRQAYEDEETGQTYNPNGEIGGTAYGIYAESGSYVTNTGTIKITGAENGTGVYLENGAQLENSGTIMFNGSSDNISQTGEAIDIYGDGTKKTTVDLNDLGGEIILGQGGRFFADSLKGDMSVSEKNVLGSFDNQYVLTGALQADDVDELNLNSKSAMFVANSQQNQNGGYDVVMTRQNFNDIIDDGNISDYLENNYIAGNGSKIFDSLKTADSKNALNQKAANLLGTDMFPNFRREDALLYRNLSRQFNDNLFNQPNQNYIGGYKYVDISTDADGTLMGTDGQAHVAYGMLKNKANNGVTYGLGASIAKLDSDYDNGSKRNANIFGVWAPLGYDFKNGTQWFSKAYLGYVDGSYDRLTDLQKYSADFNEYQYGVSNEIRYNLNLGGGFTFSPLAELNLFGVYSDGYDEGDNEGAIHTDSQNDLSLEGGLGAYLAKKVDFDNDSHLTIQIGGVYYVEFLDPDDGFDASISALDGKYKLSHKSDDDRAVLSARVNYNYKDITLYGNIEKETAHDKSLLIDAGVQYKF